MGELRPRGHWLGTPHINRLSILKFSHFFQANGSWDRPRLLPLLRYATHDKCSLRHLRQRYLTSAGVVASLRAFAPPTNMSGRNLALGWLCGTTVCRTETRCTRGQQARGCLDWLRGSAKVPVRRGSRHAAPGQPGALLQQHSLRSNDSVDFDCNCA
jgi:hypothetical protein